MNVSEEQATANDADRAAFESWFEQSEPRLRAALVVTFGADLGRDAAAEALSYAWEHRSRVLELDNPIGYAFRVGQRWAQRHQQRGRRGVGLTLDEDRPPGFEPALHHALDALPLRQRQVVVLCIGYGLTHAEAAEVLGVSRSTIQNHADDATAADVAAQMVRRMNAVGAQTDIVTSGAALGRSPYEILIIASMIEEEANVAGDRDRISRVIHNRLFVTASNPEDPFPLQIDSAVIYGRNRADIDPNVPFGRVRTVPTDWNTYLLPGSRVLRSPRRAGRRSRQPSIRHRTRRPTIRSAAICLNRGTASSSSTCVQPRMVRCCSPQPANSTSPTSNGPGISA